MTKLWRASTRRDPAASRRHTLILAFHVTNRYFYEMLFDMVRRISAILLTLSLAFGPGALSVHASSMGAKMAAVASSATHSPSKCDDCGAAKAGMSGGTCAVNCSGLTAFFSADEALFDWLPVNTRKPYGARHGNGHTAPPEPYPPRPTILS
jgi:hypothetical protein